jgi:predicted translin family RNA/ssDNA-binding protein
MKKYFCSFALLFAFPISFLGCKNEQAPVEKKAPHSDHDHDHDHDHHEKGHTAESETGTALERLIKKSNEVAGLSDKVIDARSKSDLEPVHDELHDVGHLLESMGELTKQSTLPDGEKSEMVRIVKDLFEHFGKIDESLHGGAKFKSEEVAPKISAAIVDLRSLIKKLN